LQAQSFFPERNLSNAKEGRDGLSEPLVEASSSMACFDWWNDQSHCVRARNYGGGLSASGYSPIHQAISDLGVGANGSLLDTIAGISRLLLIAFGVAFALLMQRVLTGGWRWVGSAFLALRGLALVTTAIFTEAPSTVAIHSLAGTVGAVSIMSAFLVIGLGLRRNSQWRRWGTYSLVAAVVTLLLVAVEFWVFTPGTSLAPEHLGGLMERVVYLETLAWYVIFGWRLFVLGESPKPEGLPQG
jgi:NADH:ubiquinone oxidoreductase subunit 6 (subunit J)